MSKKASLFCICCLCVLLFPAMLSAGSAAEYYAAGKAAQQNEDWYEAIEQLLEAVQLNPAYGEAWYALAECTYGTGEYELSLLYLDKADTLIKNRPDLQNLRGFNYICLGRTDEAKALFQQILTTYPNDVEARFGLAELEILEGRVSGAEKQYQAALQRQSRNSRAILSLALVSWELGKKEAADNYIEQALRYFSGNAEVYYFAAYLAVQEKQSEQAEVHVRKALQLKPDYDEAYRLLSDILFTQKRYEEVLEICTYRITFDRNCLNAWYLRGTALTELGRLEEAFTAYETGLSIYPQDELMRAALEMLVLNNTGIDNPRRAELARYHTKKAGEYTDKFLSVQALYEYQRALRLNPFDTDARLAYAGLLLDDGFTESYLSQLEFVQNRGASTRTVDDIIEAYQSLLYDTLPVRWGVNPLYLDKNRWSAGLYYIQPAAEDLHQNATGIAAAFYADMFSSASALSVQADGQPVSSFTEAFSRARASRYDYFGMFSLEENEREVTLTCRLYSGRTGNSVASWSVYRTGNDMYASAMQKMVEKFNQVIPYYGTIIARNGTDLLLDVGRADGAASEQTWEIVAKGKVRTADFGSGIVYDPSDVLGTVTLQSAGEEISAGVMVQNGFYDRVNVGDLVVLKGSEDTAEASDASGVLEEAVGTTPQEPALLQLLRRIR